MTIKTYSASDVDIIIAGIPIGGYADGTFVTFSRDNPAFVNSTGSDGEGSRSKSSDESGTIVITVTQTSEANDALSALHALDLVSGDGIGSLMIKDGSGRTVVTAETAFIEKYADGEFARELTNREWTLKTDSLKMFIGGN